MTMPTDNETWLINHGDVVIQRKASEGIGALTSGDLLVYCLWVLDYSMRNAGDLGVAADVYTEYRNQGLKAATALGLPLSTELFSGTEADIQCKYFDVFEEVCTELRNVYRSA